VNYQISFIIKSSFLFGSLVIAFSLIGFILEVEKSPSSFQFVDPIQVLSFLSVEHLVGHIVWGLMIGFVTLSFRYIILTGFFAILVDADNLLRILGLEESFRMAHSIPFGILAAVVMMLVFGRRDWRLGVISFGAILAHMSFDIISGRSGSFRIFSPFYIENIYFEEFYWVVFLLIGFGLVGIVTFFTRRKQQVA
tara:strand:- start:457 stop:1041 length:585 start_codon:yes stop_codon:yes gene_type:complete